MSSLGHMVVVQVFRLSLPFWQNRGENDEQQITCYCVDLILRATNLIRLSTNFNMQEAKKIKYSPS